jgi:hypothetical protein
MAKSKARRSSARKPQLSMLADQASRASADAGCGVPKRQASAGTAPKVIALDLPCTSEELAELKNILPISNHDKRNTSPLTFSCRILPSDAQSESRVVELVQWLLSISRSQKREGS